MTQSSTPDPTPAATSAPPPSPGLPAGARFDPTTGAELATGDRGGERRNSYALHPGEPVLSFNVVTSLLPLASGSAPQTYRWALALGLLIPVVAGALGFLAFAFVAAALAVPIVYVVYLYDVNQWEDEPLGVVLGAVGAAAALGVAWTFIWHAGILGNDLATVNYGSHDNGGIRWSSLLVMVLLVPIVSEALKQVGPIFLSMRPKFDDLIDALTFGVAAGASFAAAETLVVNRSLFSSFGHVDHPNSGFWISLILSAAIVKPIVYGAATGIALAGFSGLGAGYDGFKLGYVRGLAEALAANIVFQGGLFFAARIQGTSGAVIGLVWGAIVAAVLVVRLRYLLHFAVLEAALESASTGVAHKDAAHGTAYCPTCEMPLLEGASFCVVCGTSVRSGNKVTKARNRAVDAGEPTTPAKPTLARQPAGVAPRDNNKTALVVGSIAVSLVLAGAVGQAIAAAATPSQNNEPPATVPVTLNPKLAAGAISGRDLLPDLLPGVGRIGADQGLVGGLRAAPTTSTPGTLVNLTSTILFLMPKGFKLQDNPADYAQVFGYKGYFFAIDTPTKTTINAMITANLTGISNIGVQQLKYSTPQQVSVSNTDVAVAGDLSFAGVLATQQGGTVPVQGFAYYFSLRDGTGVTAFALYGKGAIKNKKLVSGYNTMLNTLVSTL